VDAFQLAVSMSWPTAYGLMPSLLAASGTGTWHRV
jgi:hypothetical protein